MLVFKHHLNINVVNVGTSKTYYGDKSILTKVFNLCYTGSINFTNKYAVNCMDENWCNAVIYICA